MKKFFISFIILGIILTPCSFGFSVLQFVRAETPVNEVIHEGDRWIKANSPYIISGGILINDNGTLIIDPGVVVKLEKNAGIRVEGKLIVNGEENDPVIFTSIYDDEAGEEDNSDWSDQPPQPGDWRAIHAYEDSEVDLNYAVVRYGGFEEVFLEKNNNKILAPSNAYAQEAWGENMGAILVSEEARVNINNSVIADNTIGMETRESWNEEFIPILNIHNSEIRDNQLAGIVNYNSNQIDARNNWWGDDAGPSRLLNFTHPSNEPGYDIYGDVLFDPWIGKQEKKDPVIIVPGIMGSYLYNQIGEEVWPAIDKMIIDPWDNYLSELILPEDGVPTGNSILMPDGIFKKIINKDFFQGLIDELKNNGYEEGENLFVFPYDWRWDLNWTAGIDPIPQVQSLAEKVAQIKLETGADKVDIIAHSMGGLIAKKYIKDYGGDSVNKFIDIATPHLGAPKAFKILMYGDNLGFQVLKIFNLNEQRVFYISQNFSSVYQLLPSQNYFNSNDNDYAYYIYDMHDLDNNGIKGRLDYDQSIEFMANTGRNEYLLGFNNTLHNDLDNYSPQQDNIATYNIVGCGSPTIGQIFIMNKEKSGGNEYGLKYINGDETVPLKSANTLSADDTYFVTGTKHAYLPSVNGVRQLIISILKNEQNSFIFSQYNNLSQEKNNCSFSGTQISFHSPIELHVYDENNNHLGPAANGDIEMGIESAQYDIIEGNKFVFLPEGRIYKIIGKATGAGSFNARIQNIENGEYTQTVYYNEMPLKTASTTVQFEVNDNQEYYQMRIDQDGDQVFEQIIEPSSILNQTESHDLTKPETEIIITGEQSIEGKYINNVLAELTAQDNEDGSGILKTEYSLNNGESWIIYEEPFVLGQAGEHSILYSSTDRAGNIEEVKKLTIAIKTINIETVIKEIEMFYNNGMITKKMVERQLINKLNWIQKYIERYGKREIRRGNIFGRVLEKCKQRKPENWCEEKLGGKFDKIDYKLNKIHQKIIVKQYQNILQLLKHYNQKQWISDWAYAIIKEDIGYLINNLE